MKKFAFSLEKVLDLRKFSEDEARIELGRATGALAELERRIAALGVERSRAASLQYAPENDADAIRQTGLYLLRLDAAKERLLQAAAEAARKVEAAREVFVRASRERETLDKLRDKQAAVYRKEFLAEETKLLDDIRPAAGWAGGGG